MWINTSDSIGNTIFHAVMQEQKWKHCSSLIIRDRNPHWSVWSYNQQLQTLTCWSSGASVSGSLWVLSRITCSKHPGGQDGEGEQPLQGVLAHIRLFPVLNRLMLGFPPMVLLLGTQSNQKYINTYCVPATTQSLTGCRGNLPSHASLPATSRISPCLCAASSALDSRCWWTQSSFQMQKSSPLQRRSWSGLRRSSQRMPEEEQRKNASYYYNLTVPSTAGLFFFLLNT